MSYTKLVIAGLLFTIIFAGIVAIMQEKGKPTWVKKDRFGEILISIAAWMILAKDIIPKVREVKLSEEIQLGIIFIGFLIYIFGFAPAVIWTIAQGLKYIA